MDLLFFFSLSLLIIAHAWLICHNSQQFLLLKILTWIYFIAPTTSLLLMLWKGDLYRISVSSNEGCFDTGSRLTRMLKNIAEVYLGFDFQKFEHSLAWGRLNTKELFLLTRSKHCVVFSDVVLLESCKYFTFSLRSYSCFPFPKHHHECHSWNLKSLKMSVSTSSYCKDTARSHFMIK